MSYNHFDLKHISWKYINEGNVHVVLELIGTNRVLRLIKDDSNFNLTHVQCFIDFVNLIMLPMFSGHVNVGNEELVQLREEDLIELGDKLLKFRPKSRLFKSSFSEYAIQAPNLTIVHSECEDNYCVEIKPKEGFLSHSLIGYGKCYYCLKQHLKLKGKVIEKISNYCPLDLFSGKTRRMYRAVYNLIVNPQNNLKVFRNGTIVYNDKSVLSDLILILDDIPAFKGSINLFIRFIIKVLLHNNKECFFIKEINENDYIIKENNICDTASSLNHDCILNDVLQLQKHTEYVDIDVKNYEKDPYGYVNTMISIVNDFQLNLSDKEDREKFLHKCEPMHLAMLSAISRDCSIMLSFSRNAISKENIKKAKIIDNEISYKIAITDLEPKPLTTITKRKMTEEKLIETYKSLNIC